MKRGQLGQYLYLQLIETKPSNLRNVPWITLKEHKVSLSSFFKLGLLFKTAVW